MLRQVVTERLASPHHSLGERLTAHERVEEITADSSLGLLGCALSKQGHGCSDRGECDGVAFERLVAQLGKPAEVLALREDRSRAAGDRVEHGIYRRSGAQLRQDRWGVALTRELSAVAVINGDRAGSELVHRADDPLKAVTSESRIGNSRIELDQVLEPLRLIGVRTHLSLGPNRLGALGGYGSCVGERQAA